MTARITPFPQRIESAIAERFGEKISVGAGLPAMDEVARIVEHRSHRKFTRQAVDLGVLRLLFACALSAPCVGYPAEVGRISARLPLEVTVHVDRYDETHIKEKIETYDSRRHQLQPFRKPRHAQRYGKAEFYGWSEDKARQYAVPERADFGAFIRAKGFSLD